MLTDFEFFYVMEETSAGEEVDDGAYWRMTNRRRDRCTWRMEDYISFYRERPHSDHYRSWDEEINALRHQVKFKLIEEEIKALRKKLKKGEHTK